MTKYSARTSKSKTAVFVAAGSEASMRKVARDRKNRDRETGGILVGQLTAQGPAIVLSALPPPSDSLSGPRRFVRGEKGIKDFFDQNPGLDYIGEWHSHLNGSRVPSEEDKLSMAAIAAQLGRPVVLAIVSLPPRRSGIIDLYFFPSKDPTEFEWLGKTRKVKEPDAAI